ncbi:MAG: hypothetical protein HN348_26160 [Proteobacteria bacterium]|nr:hypothetical protein [Pseudomonadota bacterium]
MDMYPQTGEIAGIVDNDALGEYLVMVTVVDDGYPELYDVVSFTWTISDRSVELACDDGHDDDGDGLVDCEDGDCHDSCRKVCDDLTDNDGDGLVDFNDDDCSGNRTTVELR